MHTGIFLASIVLILSALIFLLFAIIGIVMIVRGRKRHIKANRVRGIFMIILGIVIAFIISWSGISYFYTELLWFKSLGYESLCWKLTSLPWILFAKFGLIAFVFMLVNFYIAWRLCPIPGSFQRWGAGRTSTVNKLIISGILLVSIIMGSVAIPYWDEFRRYEEREPYVVQNEHTGKEEIVTDPQFGKDLSYYLFTMPVRNFQSLWTKGLFFVTLLFIGLQYDFYRRRDSQTKIYVMKRGVFHLSFLWLLILAVSIWRSDVNIYRLVYSENGFVTGVGYTDVTIRIPAYHIYMVIVGLVALAVIINSFWKKRFMITVPIAIWFGSYIMLLWVVPFIFQYIKVSPNQPILEREYISRNIEYTRMGFDLDRVKVSEITPEVATLDKLNSHPSTLKNVQLWDRRATLDFFNQDQVFRTYYHFWDVDADRYTVTDPTTNEPEYRQVMISAREMDSSRLDPKSRTWVTQRLTYTHGYGVCLGPVNEFTPKGEPYLWIRSIPPVISYPGLKITRPEIYYGEVPRNYVFVHTSQKEFDYPAQEGADKKIEDHYSTYEGTGGVPIESLFRRFMLATRFHDIRIITSEYLKPESKMLFNRQVLDRVKHIAPFLLYDNDPYIVIGDSGRLWWMIDVYTVSKSFPYSESYHDKFNYIRNPFKAVIDAYNGDVNFYVWDENEVITKVYSKAFPELFKSKEEMPDGLYKHKRYPIDLTQIQSEMYCYYHMQDPQEFYSRADRWDLPEELYFQPSKETKSENAAGESVDSRELKAGKNIFMPVVPLYVMINVPGANKPEFVSIISYTPWPTRDRPNMVAWMVVRNDVPHYGEIFVYAFPKGQDVAGPALVETRIDANKELAKDFSLWDQGGSSLIRGSLLVLPVDNALFYAEPLYLKAQITKMPVLIQVVVVTGDRIAWAENFDMALAKLFGVGERVEPTTGTPETQDPLTTLTNSLNEKIAQFKTQVQSNDVNVGKTLEEIKKLMIELEKYKK